MILTRKRVAVNLDTVKAGRREGYVWSSAFGGEAMRKGDFALTSTAEDADQGDDRGEQREGPTWSF